MPDTRTILFISGEYPPAIGGVGDYTQQLGRTLYARGNRVSVLTTHNRRAVHDAREPAVINLGGGFGWRAGRRIERVLAQVEPDIVHIQYQTGAYNQHPAINLLPGWLRRHGLSERIVVTAHDLRLPYLFPKADLVRNWGTTQLFNTADALIVTNPEDAQRVRGLAPPDRTLYSPRAAVRTPLHIIPIGSNIAPQPPADYDRQQWRERLGLADDQVLIAYFGLLSRTKGVLELLAALAALPPRFRLLIIGGAAPQPDDRRYAAEVHAAISVQNLGARVTLTGPCSAADVSAHLCAADIAALPFSDGASYRRGSLLAALAHGLPVITTAPSTPLDPPLIDREHAMLLPDPTPERLRAAIDRLAGDPYLRTKLAGNARVLADHFGWPTIAAQHEAVYDSLITAARTRG